MKDNIDEILDHDISNLLETTGMMLPWNWWDSVYRHDGMRIEENLAFEDDKNITAREFRSGRQKCKLTKI